MLYRKVCFVKNKIVYYFPIYILYEFPKSKNSDFTNKSLMYVTATCVIDDE